MTPNPTGAAGPLLSVEHLTVRFGASTVVDDVSFTIAPGEKFALVGESGSGKSITALSILRLVRDAQTAGAIRFAGEDLLALPEQRLRGIRGAEIGDDLPGADDGAEPALHGRQPDRRGARAAPGPAAERRAGARRRAARAHRDSRAANGASSPIPTSSAAGSGSAR